MNFKGRTDHPSDRTSGSGIDVRPVEGQIDDLIGEINKETEKAIKFLSQH